MKSRIKTAVAKKDYKSLNAATKPFEQTISKLSCQAGRELGAYTRTRFEIGNAVSAIMKEVRDAKYLGGFKAYHEDRKIQVPRTTCQTYANAYEDIACLGLKDEVLNAAFAAGIDLVKSVGRIKGAKAEVIKMDGPRFVAFLKYRPTPKPRLKLENVGDFVNAGIIALKEIFDKIKDEEMERRAWAGIALEISSLGTEEKWTGGKFTVPSPLATDELEALLSEQREV
jgi:hypothetical protein